MDLLRNKEVKQEIHPTLLNKTTAKRKGAPFGNVVRGSSGTVFCNIIEGFILGRRPR